MARGTVTLYQLAIEHDGLFTAAEARLSGISPHSLVQAERRGIVSRLARGIYRLVNYPANEERTQLWEAVLWPAILRGDSLQLGVLSHLSALRLNYPELEYIAPKVSLTVSRSQRVRREQPSWLDLHYGNIADSELTHDNGGLPFTTLQRTLFDCIAARVDRRLIERSIKASERSEIDEPLDAATITQLRAMMRIV